VLTLAQVGSFAVQSAQVAFSSRSSKDLSTRAAVVGGFEQMLVFCIGAGGGLESGVGLFRFGFRLELLDIGSGLSLGLGSRYFF